MRIALVANTSWYLFNFRLNLMKSLIDHGHTVYAISPTDKYSPLFEKYDVETINWKLSGASTNPFLEIVSVLHLRRIFSREKIHLVLSFTPKGNLYSGLAALASEMATLPNISGLGQVFSKPGWLQSLVQGLYRVSLRNASKVFFQNENDRALFIDSGLVKIGKTDRLMGSGVDLLRFPPMPLPWVRSEDEHEFTFILAARLIWEKGIHQYAEAARVLKTRFPTAVFKIVGPYAPSKKNAVKKADIDQWVREGLIQYIGVSDEMPSVLAKVDCVVLPSYYNEGVPRILLEASAAGRPCITTDTPGCRDAIEDNVTGFLCKEECSDSLANAMSKALLMSKDQFEDMGANAVLRMQTLFDEKTILGKYVNVIEEMPSKHH